MKTILFTIFLAQLAISATADDLPQQSLYNNFATTQLGYPLSYNQFNRQNLGGSYLPNMYGLYNMAGYSPWHGFNGMGFQGMGFAGMGFGGGYGYFGAPFNNFMSPYVANPYVGYYGGVKGGFFPSPYNVGWYW